MKRVVESHQELAGLEDEHDHCNCDEELPIMQEKADAPEEEDMEN